MPSPLSNHHSSQRRLSTLSPPPYPYPYPYPATTLTVNSPTSLDLSSPPSASSATTSFRADWSSDGANPSTTNTAGRQPEDIEMDPIAPTGHRRRRSTLTATNPSLTQPSNSRTSRPRATSIKSSGDLEAKISEESHSRDASRSDNREDDSMSEEDLHDDEETGLTKKDKRRKQAKRRRNTRLDQRIARDKITDEERKEADQNVVKKLTINITLILLWYLFSLSISLYNKWMFDSGQLNFAFPLFTTSLHMIVQFTLAGLVLYFIPSLRPGSTQNHSDLGRSRHEIEPERPIMTKLFYLTRIGPCGAATGLDIGLGNTSLKFITLTFYTMCKSSSLAFVLIFAFLFRLETPTWKLVAIIATMTGGVVMMVAGEVEFELGGFILVIAAAFFSGFRWGLTQILLLRNPATSNPFSSIFFLAPIMFLTLILIAIPAEGIFELIEGLRVLSNEWGVVKTPLILLFPGTIAFLMTASEFALLQRSSVVTLSIAGIFKEVVTISAAALVFDDRLTPINISGLVITICAIGAYNWIKLSKMRNDAQLDVHTKGYQAQSGSSSEVDRGSDSDEEETGLLAHDDASGVEDNLLPTSHADLMSTPRPSSSTEPHRTERSRED
ncbi:triose-phosphate transporter family-domain-containing protein [Hypoxylon fragiforme]|uniref:triose-phosphate transporter family-domain-containing protein n=1 Tax=Hypoxylon fragiforme TaxID=63214 RepID=UPI0020C73E0E|nr:triose-phosphate transporter family-domain-containing protein [Hypoxylon fragiforme]KAI2607507.1 triose-phosphate transporter family-domain-containing protein [Hypoxylon fragiforme]